MFRFWVTFLFLFCLVFIALPSSALAHKVNIFAYAEGDSVYTESYFPDGRKVTGGKIEVYECGGEKLFEGTTDNNGQFDFRPSRICDLEIVLDASMGHRNTCIISKDELSNPPDAAKEPLPHEEREGIETDLAQIERIVDASLEKRLAPLTRKLSKLEAEKVSFKDIIGGIGYIFGIAGIAFFCLSGRKAG